MENLRRSRGLSVLTDGLDASIDSHDNFETPKKEKKEKVYKITRDGGFSPFHAKVRPKKQKPTIIDAAHENFKLPFDHVEYSLTNKMRELGPPLKKVIHEPPKINLNLSKGAFFLRKPADDETCPTPPNTERTPPSTPPWSPRIPDLGKKEFNHKKLPKTHHFSFKKLERKLNKLIADRALSSGDEHIWDVFMQAQDPNGTKSYDILMKTQGINLTGDPSVGASNLSPRASMGTVESSSEPIASRTETQETAPLEILPGEDSDTEIAYVKPGHKGLLPPKGNEYQNFYSSVADMSALVKDPEGDAIDANSKGTVSKGSAASAGNAKDSPAPDVDISKETSFGGGLSAVEGNTTQENFDDEAIVETYFIGTDKRPKDEHDSTNESIGVPSVSQGAAIGQSAGGDPGQENEEERKTGDIEDEILEVNIDTSSPEYQHMQQQRLREELLKIHHEAEQFKRLETLKLIDKMTKDRKVKRGLKKEIFDTKMKINETRKNQAKEAKEKCHTNIINILRGVSGKEAARMNPWDAQKGPPKATKTKTGGSSRGTTPAVGAKRQNSSLPASEARSTIEKKEKGPKSYLNMKVEKLEARSLP